MDLRVVVKEILPKKFYGFTFCSWRNINLKARDKTKKNMNTCSSQILTAVNLTFDRM